MAPGSTQTLAEMSTRNLLGGTGRPARGADNLTAICEPTVYKMWEPRRITTLWAFMACYRDSFNFTFTRHYILDDSAFHILHLVKDFHISRDKLWQQMCVKQWLLFGITRFRISFIVRYNVCEI
jgi:hypothetical protein